eukprot:COSAG06_NODE_67891_length_249_cov_13.760000_1_plen_29_part_01
MPTRADSSAKLLLLQLQRHFLDLRILIDR